MYSTYLTSVLVWMYESSTYSVSTEWYLYNVDQHQLQYSIHISS